MKCQVCDEPALIEQIAGPGQVLLCPVHFVLLDEYRLLLQQYHQASVDWRAGMSGLPSATGLPINGDTAATFLDIESQFLHIWIDWVAKKRTEQSDDATLRPA